MELKEENKDQLVIESDFASRAILNFVYFSLALLVLSLVWLSRSQEPLDEMEKFTRGLYRFLGIAGVAVMIAVAGEMIDRCRMNKKEGLANLVVRAGWYLWLPRQIKIPLKNIQAVKLSKVGKGVPQLYLLTSSGASYRFVGEANARVAESISRFLEIPLHIELDLERITHIPCTAENASRLIPTPCASCGAPLPRIEADVQSIQCSHCGMNMIIQWQEDKLSYRAANELEI